MENAIHNSFVPAQPQMFATGNDPGNSSETTLSPAQQRAFDELSTILTATPVAALVGIPGSGRTTILNALAKKYNGRVVGMTELLAWSQTRNPESTDEAIQHGIEQLLSRYELVLIDGYHATFQQRGSREGHHIRTVIVSHLVELTNRLGKRLVMCECPLDTDAGQHMMNNPFFVSGEVVKVTLGYFEKEDYAALCRSFIGASSCENIDFRTVHRYAAGLTGYQLRIACRSLKTNTPTTADFIEALDVITQSGNIKTAQVETLAFESLPGTEEISEKLESQIILPIQNRKLALELGLKPKKGVLLFGPPGTGKTSIGRALAHRMKGKFFMIDGTYVTEPPNAFFAKLRNVVKEAQENAPSVLFIDDADVLFSIDHIAGLSRYLLTLLDGLEGESENPVCIMMTAMDVRKVPEALLRSGRVELWLETAAPTEQARGKVLQRWMGTELPDHESTDYAMLAQATENFTPADLRRIAGDAKALYAADVLKEQPLSNATGYLSKAIEQLKAARNRMAGLLNDAGMRLGSREVKEKYMVGMGGLAENSVGCKNRGW